ncbi:hypothetical protein GOODEAATRI_006714, partial [Goodea atripinnis]
MFTAPHIKEEAAKKFIRLKRQAGYWDPHHSQNMWGFTIQEQAVNRDAEKCTSSPGQPDGSTQIENQKEGQDLMMRKQRLKLFLKPGL